MSNRHEKQGESMTQYKFRNLVHLILPQHLYLQPIVGSSELFI